MEEPFISWSKESGMILRRNIYWYHLTEIYPAPILSFLKQLSKVYYWNVADMPLEKNFEWKTLRFMY